jgi:hypothetical protein
MLKIPPGNSNISLCWEALLILQTVTVSFHRWAERGQEEESEFESQLGSFLVPPGNSGWVWGPPRICRE